MGQQGFPPVVVNSVLPLDLLCRLGNEESDSVGGEFGASGVDGDFVVGAIISLDLNGQKEQFQFDKTKSGCKGRKREGSICMCQKWGEIVSRNVLP